MRAFKTISNPEAFKLLGDESRRKILFFLRAKEMTVSQIAQELNLTPQTVYFHIKKLLEGGMVEVAREVRVDHLIESYYQATAEVFHFTVGKTSQSKETLTEQIEATLSALKRVGFKIECDKKIVDQLAELQLQIQDCCRSKELEEKVAGMEDVDFFTKQDVQEYAGLLSMTSQEIAQEDEIKKKFRNLLRSTLRK
jgi:DNA-binding transcriptional ArsR family regulator